MNQNPSSRKQVGEDMVSSPTYHPKLAPKSPIAGPRGTVVESVLTIGKGQAKNTKGCTSRALNRRTSMPNKIFVAHNYQIGPSTTRTGVGDL